MSPDSFWPVLALVALAAFFLFPRRKNPSPAPPRALRSISVPDAPLPPDQRAHVTFLAAHAEDEELRHACLKIMVEDDRRRGRAHRPPVT